MNLSDLLPDENYLFDLKIRTEGMGDWAVSSMEVVPEVLGDRGAFHAGRWRPRQLRRKRT